ncbi:tRNA (N6-isopentenyl adenosine(37)-C2)-methylthiotransferase MiaB [Candidatus Beckwithbacteria bacterium CG10_big_fil_rev_8_21_14_0_10_34_10]|uniref:tRNA-2-methylthio-N(6)-dimethylallyladenosine synthase n=1 Tax=Candidatus Beckwithbacteria bacterium CG10_big_fil_rev_8_21_14_0_10_34_10 TaxID=1974495 RepID=A0A2H0W9Y4_9BACT|nr:MAG: tRNA (N6-isopentenyl adenosine(37)-C2)-methylthiotransferase MiaB [Candidatus Beckwithbacteria bacterium CG10_big_fil_rev_8_21_14_0_10_34_10]
MRYFVKTYGCQMNKLDSEKIAGALGLKGYWLVGSYKKADLVVINTCSVRQSAEDRVLGLLNNISKLKKKPRVILTGCMLRYSLKQLKKMMPLVDQFVEIEKLTKGVEPLREDKNHAWVIIMTGCDNYCTYCVVPFARGREKSLGVEEIYCQILELVKRGYSKITLLGQNVNSYHKNKAFKVKDKKLKKKILLLEKKYQNNFAVLLGLLNEIKGLEKISFMTSNPHDFTDGIIKALKLSKIDRYLHLAVQSGDDRILRRMNRKHTRKDFLDLIKKIRKSVPEIELGTDIIVGFPKETEAQFQKTVSLVKKVGFSVGFINKYSSRLGTAAYKFKDDVSIQEKKRRFGILDKIINKKKK